FIVLSCIDLYRLTNQIICLYSIHSGKNDDVFIYFTDHGAPGLIAFPDDDLHAKQFMATLKYLHNHKRYSKLVIYIEACESGSMFQGILPSNLNIYATTAASPTESSYGTFCDDPKIPSCLADLYSYDWIVDSQTHQLTRRTLDQQYREVKRETDLSHVQRYGDKVSTYKIHHIRHSRFGNDRQCCTANLTIEQVLM
ncbi:unnamed protein product, partial [Schistosoma margrebowiei]